MTQSQNGQDMTEQALILNRDMVTALDIIGDRWTLLILRDTFLGRCRFEEFRQHTGASRATLSQRLERLVAGDILYRRAYGEGSNRFEYRLTVKGLELFGASLLAWQWEREWSPQDDLPRQLHHALCGHPLQPRAQCRNCQATLKIRDVSWPAGILGAQFSEIRSLSGQRRARSDARGSDRALTTISDLIGDRWTLLILIAAFFGVKRYDEFQKQLGIASNILTARLSRLVDAGIVNRRQYQQNPPRSDYRLTTKGESLYPLVIVLRQWAGDRRSESGSTATLLHNCGQPLTVDVVCGNCGQKPWPKDVVTFARP